MCSTLKLKFSCIWGRIRIQDANFVYTLWVEDMLHNKYVFEVFIDEKLIKSITNEKPATFQNVDGVIGRGNFATGKYQNFDFSSIAESSGKDKTSPI